MGCGCSRRSRPWRRARAPAARSTCGGTPISTPRCRAPRCARSRAASVPPNQALAIGAPACGRLGRRRSAFRSTALAAALLALTIAIYIPLYTHGAEAPHAAEHRDRRRRGRAAAGDRLGRGDGKRCRPARSRCSCSSSSGRRRISGRWRSAAAATTSASACRCCRTSSVPPKPAGRSRSMRSCSCRPRSGRSLIPGVGLLYAVVATDLRRRAALAGPCALSGCATPRTRRAARRRWRCSATRSSTCS